HTRSDRDWSSDVCSSDLYPYPYVSADATPLFILAINDYAVQSGDLQFVKEKWDNLWRAYQFMRSTYDEQGFAKNLGVGHGWVERSEERRVGKGGGGRGVG